MLAGVGGGGEGDGLGDVVGGDLPKLFGVGFFHERLLVSVNHVRGIAGPARGLALVLVVGEMVAEGCVPHIVRDPGAQS